MLKDYLGKEVEVWCRNSLQGMVFQTVYFENIYFKFNTNISQCRVVRVRFDIRGDVVRQCRGVRLQFEGGCLEWTLMQSRVEVWRRGRRLSNKVGGEFGGGCRRWRWKKMKWGDVVGWCGGVLFCDDAVWWCGGSKLGVRLGVKAVRRDWGMVPEDHVEDEGRKMMLRVDCGGRWWVLLSWGAGGGRGWLRFGSRSDVFFRLWMWSVCMEVTIWSMWHNSKKTLKNLYVETVSLFQIHFLHIYEEVENSL